MTPARLEIWPPLPPGAHLRRPRTAMPFPLSQPNVRIWRFGRHCLWHGVKALGMEPGGEILVPAYHHGSEIQALVERGLKCRFYGGSDGLAPDEEELGSLSTSSVGALLLIHYLGFPQETTRWRRWCDDRGLLLIEDAAQAWLASHDGRPVGALGDASIFCLYKTFGVPDGAALLTGDPPPSAASTAAGVTRMARRHGTWLVSRSGPLATLGRHLQHRGGYVPEGFGLGDPDQGPFRTTRYLLPRIADPAAAQRRRFNYAFLLEELGAAVPAPFDRLSGSESPFAFPVETKGKEKVLGALESSGIGALDFWARPHHMLPVEQFPALARRRARTIGLPVHQELRRSDLDRIRRSVATLIDS
jgi:dTDP-4-amino-4,6-dideoxygalactose transaminase